MLLASIPCENWMVAPLWCEKGRIPGKKCAATAVQGFAHHAKTPPRGGENRGIPRRPAMIRRAVGTRGQSHDSSPAIGPARSGAAAADRRTAALGMAAGSGGWGSPPASPARA
jgi:hypothetical protein